MTATAPIALSRSEISLWERCPRQWLITYYYGFLPAGASPLGSRNFGIRLHTALEGHYGYGLDPLMVVDVLYKAEIEAHPDDEHELRSDWEMSRIMISGYLEWVDAEGCDANLQVVATEAEVRVPLPGFEGAVELRSKMDQIVLDTQTGLHSFFDHKSADSFKRHEIVELDPQMGSYSLVQWLASGQPPPVPGYEVEPRRDVPLVMGGIVNTLRRVKRTKNSKPPYYGRHPFRFVQEQLAATLCSIQESARQILAARQQLDACDGQLHAVQMVQLSTTRPVKILHDCSWSCPLASGMCQMMDRGTSWAEALVTSGRYVQGDPYAYYSRQGAAAIAAAAATG